MKLNDGLSTNGEPNVPEVKFPGTVLELVEQMAADGHPEIAKIISELATLERMAALEIERDRAVELSKEVMDCSQSLKRFAHSCQEFIKIGLLPEPAGDNIDQRFEALAQSIRSALFERDLLKRELAKLREKQ